MCESVPTKCFCLFLHPKRQDVCSHVGVLCTKHTSERTHACTRRRLGLWRGCLWDAGKLWPKLARGRAVTLQRSVKKAHSESRNTAEWGGGRATREGDTKEAFIRSGFSLAVNGTSGADAAAVGLNSGLIAQGRA